MQSKYTRHSLRLSEVEIDTRLKEYFAEHDLLLRTDFQELCGMARTTANNHLQRLQREGKLMNVGRRTQPIYRPLPGYYGRSREAADQSLKARLRLSDGSFSGKVNEYEKVL